MSERADMLTGAPQRNNHRNPGVTIPGAPLSTLVREHGRQSLSIL
jgi:hypothetical protein